MAQWLFVDQARWGWRAVGGGWDDAHDQIDDELFVSLNVLP